MDCDVFFHTSAHQSPGICEAGGIGRTTLGLMHFRPRVLAAALGLLGVVSLSACSRALIIEPAPQAASPDCANVMLRLPKDMDDLKHRTTSSQATAAWGDPSGAILRCGMPKPAATTDACVSVNGVDWISTEQNATTWKFVSFGRSPAVEVLVDPRKASGANVLASVSPAVSTLPQSGKCENAQDLNEDGTPATTSPRATPSDAAPAKP